MKVKAICSICGREKNGHKSKATGHHVCITCANKEWRKKNPTKQVELKKTYYSTRTTHSTNKGQFWMPGEITTITSPDRPSDQELAKVLCRSVQAIQVKRSKILTGYVEV